MEILCAIGGLRLSALLDQRSVANFLFPSGVFGQSLSVVEKMNNKLSMQISNEKEEESNKSVFWVDDRLGSDRHDGGRRD